MEVNYQKVRLVLNILGQGKSHPGVSEHLQPRLGPQHYPTVGESKNEKFSDLK